MGEKICKQLIKVYEQGDGSIESILNSVTKLLEVTVAKVRLLGFDVSQSNATMREMAKTL